MTKSAQTSQAAAAPWDDEDDGAPRSPYDAPDDAPEARTDARDAPQGAAPGWRDARARGASGDWRPLLAACAEPFAGAAAGLARLDERLRIMAPPDRAAARARLAALQACRLLWGAGVMVAPEAVALDALDRRGRAGDDAPAVTAARRLAHRLARGAPGRGAGRGPARDAADPGAGGAAQFDAALLDADFSDADFFDADEADADLRGAPPLVAAALARLCADPTREAARLDAAAARLIAAARGCRGGAVFAPAPARRRPCGPASEARLAGFLGDVADGSRDALALLDDLSAWRARADAAAAAMKGATPARMIALLARRPALSAPAAASALRLSDDAALRALARLTEAGCARELTGCRRFRVWAAKL